MLLPQPSAPMASAKSGPSAEDTDTLRHLHQAVAQGTHWFVALLEAIALWQVPEEEYQGRHYRYLLEGEAFDWLLLAERLCQELGDLIPQEEKEALLFFGRFPVELGPWEFQRLIGRAKYRAHLNYWYGVLAEEALLLAVEERFAKERHAIGFAHGGQNEDTIYQWVYGVGQQALLEQFLRERGLPPAKELFLSELREFTYWCFKYRLRQRDPAKVASDTRLGLQQFQRMRASRGLRQGIAG